MWQNPIHAKRLPVLFLLYLALNLGPSKPILPTQIPNPICFFGLAKFSHNPTWHDVNWPNLARIPTQTKPNPVRLTLVSSNLFWPDTA